MWRSTWSITKVPAYDKVIIQRQYRRAINEPGVVGINIGASRTVADETLAHPSRADDYACDDRVGASDDLWSDFWIDQSGLIVMISMLKQSSILQTGAQGEVVAIDVAPTGETHKMMVENVRRCDR